MKFTREEVIESIEKAFPSQPLGDGVSLRQAVLDDDYVTDPKLLKEAKEKDVTDDWKKVPDEDLESAFYMSVFPYLDQTGWKYYLPSAMRYSAKDVPSNSSCDFYTTSHILDYSPEKLTKFLDLTTEQQKTIAMFLVLMHELLEGGEIFETNAENYSSWLKLLN